MGRSPDAAQDELALHLAFLHRILVLTRRVWDLLCEGAVAEGMHKCGRGASGAQADRIAILDEPDGVRCHG